MSSSSPSSPLELYDSKRVQIGRGRFATVYKTKYLPTGTFVAMKIIKGIKAENREKFMREFELLSRVQHPNIISILDCFMISDLGYLVLTFCEGGPLSLKVAEGPLNDSEAARVIYSILLALDHVHSRNSLHRDVKPENVMYLTTKPDSQVLLGDFGLGKVVEEGLADSRVGTKGYQAPQILHGHLYDFKCDIWSTGIVAYELLHARLPFKVNQGEATLLQAMEREMYEIGGTVTKLAADFIRSCLKPDPQARPGAAQLLEHPWFQQIRNG
jgi:serine/threonine protein kinase